MEETYQQNYDRYWKDIVENEDGTLNKDQVMRELSDYCVFMDEVSKVYDHITGGMISKPNTVASAVIGQAEEKITDSINCYLKEVLEEIVGMMEDVVADAERSLEDNPHKNSCGAGWDMGVAQEITDLIDHIKEDYMPDNYA